MNKIIKKNGKDYLRISENIWKLYLEQTSPYKTINNNFLNPSLQCALKDKKVSWCDSCNRGIGSWSQSCIKTITSINLVKYENILLNENTKDNIIEIEIDRNDNSKVI